jgi:photosystem II stability/assembly factor-like uncharacterized protein
MNLRPLLSFCILLISLSSTTQAQPWMQKLANSNPSFEEIRDAFYDYWNGRTIGKGKGYKQFKRWEWFMQNRLMPDGKLPPSDLTVKNWDLYRQSHPEVAQKTSSAANWTFTGPSSSAGGYSGIGRLNCIAFHPTNANTFWVGSPAGGLWKTTNGGSSWTTVTDNLPVLGVSDIAIDPTNPNTMYIATGDGDMALSLSTINGAPAGDTKSIGVLKSTDGGATWNTTGLSWSVSSSKLIRRLIINPNNPQILIAAASDGIYRTTNGGTTWTNAAAAYFIDAEFKPGDPSVVYAATKSLNSQIARSTDGGATWFAVATLPNVIRINLAVTPASPTLVNAVGVNPQSGLAGMWYSNNSGAGYTQYFFGNSSNNLLHNSYNASGADGQGDYDLAFAMNPVNANETWLGGVNTWNSTDGGANWYLKNIWNGHPTINPFNVAVVHADKHFIAFHPLVPGTVFECNDGGLYKSTNGGSTWTDLSNGLGISQLYRIGVSQTVANDVICGLQDNGSKELYNNIWSDRTGGDGMECIIDYTNANVVYATYVQGQISKTTNKSTYNVIVNNNGAAGTVHAPGEWVTPYVMHPTNNQVLLVGKSQLFQSINGGTSWTQLGTIPLGGRNIIAIAYAPSNPQVIYAASQTDIFKTSNNGGTWTLVGSTAVSVPNTYLAVDPSDPNKLYVTQGGYGVNDKVWIWNGTAWTNFSGTLPNIPVNCIVAQKNSNGALYIGTDVGVFYRNSTMTDWQLYSTGLPNVVVTELEISYNDNKLWAATFGRGLWKSDLFTAANTYVFNGTGSWNTASNWMNGSMPPTTIPANAEITIDPPAAGECVYTGVLSLPAGAKVTVKAGKKFRVTP